MEYPPNSSESSRSIRTEKERGNHSCCIHGQPCRKARPALELQKQPLPKVTSPSSDSRISLPPDQKLSKQQERFVETEMRKDREDETIPAMVSSNPLAHYIGIMTSDEAEKVVTRPTSFRLYHQIGMTVEEMRSALRSGSPDAIAPIVPLYVVYRTRQGDCRHFPIVEVETIPIPTYTVDVPHFGQPRFFTISGLIRFYSCFSLWNNYNKKGQLEVDVFPCV